MLLIFAVMPLVLNSHFAALFEPDFTISVDKITNSKKQLKMES